MSTDWKTALEAEALKAAEIYSENHRHLKTAQHFIDGNALDRERLLRAIKVIEYLLKKVPYSTVRPEFLSAGDDFLSSLRNELKLGKAKE